MGINVSSPSLSLSLSLSLLSFIFHFFLYLQVRFQAFEVATEQDVVSFHYNNIPFSVARSLAWILHLFDI